MKIIIETIPHELQRYPTCGDYWIDENGVINIKVSELDNEIFNGLVAVHELVECLLCKWKGISMDAVDNFDIEFEKNRKEGDVSEAGFDVAAPYRNEHAIATAVELMMCTHMEESWVDYEKKINEL